MSKLFKYTMKNGCWAEVEFSGTVDEIRQIMLNDMANPDVYEVLDGKDKEKAELEKLEELAIANSDMLIDILLEKAERELGL